MSDRKHPDLGGPLPPDVGLGDEDPLASAREETIEVLSECFARDVLTVEDFERRAELALGARTMTDLGAAIDGIETGPLAATTQDPSLARLKRATPDLPASRIRPTDRAIAVFGETKRAGRWIPARQTTAVAVMGSTVIDVREAQFGPGETAVSALAVMGSVEIIVPPGLYVECAGSAVMGSFEEQRQVDATPFGAGAPYLRVDGFALLGSVEIKYRYAGESKREARRRRRSEKREARRQLRQERKERKRLR